MQKKPGSWYPPATSVETYISMDSISHLFMPTQLAEESNALTVLPIPLYTHDFLYAVPRVSVSRRKLTCRFRRTYDMTKELQYFQIQM